MPQDALIRRLAKLLGDVTGAPAAELGPLSSAENTHGWDSVSNLALLAAIEDEFGVSILTQEAMQVRTLADFARLLEVKGISA